MPTYEYRCPRGHTFDVFQKMSDEPGATCPECGEPAERQISAGAGFLFKGEGFYITDSRSDAYRKKAEAEKGGGSPKGDKGQKGGGGSASDGGGSKGGSEGSSSGGAKGGAGGSSSGGGSGGGSSSGGSKGGAGT